jgi:alpha-1,6-mannosyltransferase
MFAKWRTNILISFSLIFYITGSYFLERHNSTLLLLYSLLFLIYLYVNFKEKDTLVSTWVYASFIFRLALLFCLPNLSDDFYRFIWDGRLLNSGLHPFSQIPAYYIENNQEVKGIEPLLYDQLNSKNYFTVYPPLAQLIFCLSTLLSPNSILGSVIVMRILIIAAEFGSVLLMLKLLRYYKLPEKRALLYALNPLIVLELTGNLHFEVFVIFFLLLAVYMLVKEKLLNSAIAFALAVSVKLLPLIFLPLLAWQLRWKRGIIYTFTALSISLLLFIPLLNVEIINGFQESLGYYFQKFEFNASVYYLVREWGYWYYGYNIIQTVGWKLGLVSASSIILISLYKSQKLVVDWHLSIINGELWFKLTCILFVYLLFSTTIHPWYITPLLAFSVFTNYRFAFLWSLLIFFTYAGYTETGFVEIYWITFIEYTLVFTYLAFELYTHVKRTPHHILPQP